MSEDIDKQIREQQKRRRKEKGATFDRELYGDDEAEYDTSISVNEDQELVEADTEVKKKLRSFTAPKELLQPVTMTEKDDSEPVFDNTNSKKIADRESDYQKRRFNRVISPVRTGEEGEEHERYKQALEENKLAKEEKIIKQQIEKKMKEEEKRKRDEARDSEKKKKKEKKRRRSSERERDRERDRERSDRKDRDRERDRERDRDREKDRERRRDRDRRDRERDRERESSSSRKRRDRERDRERDRDRERERDHDRDSRSSSRNRSSGSEKESTPPLSEWEKQSEQAQPKKSRWDQPTPADVDDNSSASKKSRWDETPKAPSGMETPTLQATPVMSVGEMTPATPLSGMVAIEMTPDMAQTARWEADIDERNRPMTDAELDELFPGGYKILQPPKNYKPIRTPGRKLTATPSPMTQGFSIADSGDSMAKNTYGFVQPPGLNLPPIKPEDKPFFDILLKDVDEEKMEVEERKQFKIAQLLLRIKNGSPPMRKQALRQLTDRARDFAAGPLFNQILPILMSPSLEDQERHLLVKVIDRVLYKLDDLVRPWVHKILVVIEPLLIDEDYYARVEGREIISNLAKAAGLATMIAVMRPDIDNPDEYVRNTTARAFAVVASALGTASMIPFLRAVCRSKKSWEARHTGIKIVQQIAILMGCAVLPHLTQLVAIVAHGLKDEQQKVRTITALALASLAESAAPYGIESFDQVLEPLWFGIKEHRGKGLAAFLKAIGFIIPLMNPDHASYYTTEVMPTLIREFTSPDEEMKKVVLKVIKQCVSTDGVNSAYVRESINPPFFKNFWVRRMALDRRNYRALVETTVELANKVGAAEIVEKIVEDLKDESEPYRKMVIETVDKIIQNLGSSELSRKLEERLVDGIIFCFQEQTSDDADAMLNGFGTILNSLGDRAHAYLTQISSCILWRLNNKSAKARQQAADLISRVAVVMHRCNEENLLNSLGKVLYEYLGEEYPEVLGSILGALKAIVNVIGMSKMTPPIKDLLPRLTPILRNRHEKVQENCIDLVGRIADRGPEFVSAREWLRICFELLEMLKAHKKGIRRATVNTFGYIAKAIGPQDVLVTLLNNLKVQERTNRVCTTVAIAIVAETCSPFTVLPALMNEYRVPELNVQNGVLKALSFLFEYIGEMGKDYIYAVTPLLEDALIDRDLVHRQTACAVVKHMTLGVYGSGCEDALTHLLNHVWPNIFETSPHVITAVFEAVEAMRVSLGPCAVLQYVLQGLFHPARKVRSIYWKVYNACYIGQQDALTAFYPVLADDEINRYRRTELEMIV